MGQWRPEPGTIYRTLLDQCRAVFGIRGLTAPLGRPCGGAVGETCRCHWVADDFSILILTPQLYDASPFPRHMPDLRVWLRGERWWDRTTGVLHIVRTARRGSAHLDWIDLPRISDGFSLALPSEVLRTAHQVMERMIARGEWFEPLRRRDGGYDLEPATAAHPRAMRRLCIRTPSVQMIMGECLDATAMSAFEAPPGYAFPCACPEDCRLEIFLYEFKLLGRNSFEFQMAGQ
jgi:hypothetical protein